MFAHPHIIEKYNTKAPRYTSYPTALSFSPQFGREQFLQALSHSSARHLSLYLHIPFCHSLCYYCGCNKLVTRQQDKADIYLNYLQNEIRQQAGLFRQRKVRQLHLGGGTPSFLSGAQIQQLMALLRSYFNFAADAELSIEIDPRRIGLDYLDMLREAGFNRLSIGVQDTDEQVQRAINRVQSTEFIGKLVQRAQQLGFMSVNLDLIYGLPLQTSATFASTLQHVVQMRPERISLFSYAHMPERFASQRKIHDDWLPDTTQKSGLMYQAIETLCNAGYEFIGLDHFALPEDELARARRSGTLQRNFQGYTVLQDCDLLGLGVSAISAIGNGLSQNAKDLNDYYQRIDELGHGLARGVSLSLDDQIRGAVIKQLMCNTQVNKYAIEQQFDICFDRYFASELDALSSMADEQLLELTRPYIHVLPKARLLLRQIAMVFDIYARQQIQHFSMAV